MQEAGSASVVPCPPPLTAAVFGNPAHVGGQPVDVEVLPIEVGALLIPKILLQLRARFGIAGFKLHATTHAVFPTVFRPAKTRKRSCLGSSWKRDVIAVLQPVQHSRYSQHHFDGSVYIYACLLINIPGCRCLIKKTIYAMIKRDEKGNICSLLNAAVVREAREEEQLLPPHRRI